MQLTMHEILNFPAFYDLIRTAKLPMKTAYKFAKLANAIDAELAFYREKVQAIISEYGETDENGQLIPTEDGQGIKLRPGTEADCYDAMGDLQIIEVTLPDITFTIDELDKLELTLEEMNSILPFLVD